MSQTAIPEPSADLERTTAALSLTASDPGRSMRYYGATRGWRLLHLAEIWRYRELIWMFALRDIKVKYRQTMVGVAWVVLQPLVTVLVFGLLFRWMKGQPTTGATPYVVTTVCGLVAWQLFAGTITQSTHSLVVNKNLLTKVYFPRVIIPISAVVSGLVDFAIAFVVLLATMVVFRVVPTPAILALPVMVLMVLLSSLAFSLWLSALNALYRDVQYTVPFLVQIGFIVSPVVYEMEAVIPREWRLLYSLNPMVGVLEGFRWTLLGGSAPPLMTLLTSVTCMTLVLCSGLFYFRRMERHFADRI